MLGEKETSEALGRAARKVLARAVGIPRYPDEALDAYDKELSEWVSNLPDERRYGEGWRKAVRGTAASSAMSELQHPDRSFLLLFAIFMLGLLAGLGVNTNPLLFLGCLLAAGVAGMALLEGAARIASEAAVRECQRELACAYEEARAAIAKAAGKGKPSWEEIEKEWIIQRALERRERRLQRKILKKKTGTANEEGGEKQP